MFYKGNISNISLESYDAYIVSLEIFRLEEDKVKQFLENLYSFNKPVILIYEPDYQYDFKGLLYLKSKFNIKIVRKDASIIENSYEDYLPQTIDGYALSLLSSNGHGKAYIKNTKNCFILRFGNISIMHDVKLKYTSEKEGKIKPLTTLLLNLLNIPENVEEPEWIKEIKILDEEDIQDNINNISREISNLEDKKEEQKEKLEKIGEYKKVLYTSGDELVDIVQKMIIEMLNISINDLDVKKEDLSFELDNKEILVEIKGVNTSIKREYVSQTQRHIEDNAKENNIEDDDIPNKYKGLLIVNPYIKTPVNERIKKEFYSNTVKGDIEHYDICTIDTITLLALFQKFKEGKNIDLKNIILNSNYNEPDFSIIDKN